MAVSCANELYSALDAARRTVENLPLAEHRAQGPDGAATIHLRQNDLALPSKTPAQAHESEKKSVGRGVFTKCVGCSAVVTAEDLKQNFQVCPTCGHHHPMPPEGWRRLLLDDGILDLWDEHIGPADPLRFHDGKSYPDRIAAAREKTRRGEGIEIGRARLAGRPVGYGLFLFSFMGGSMGSVVGERITRLFERCTAEELPVLLLHASGGARMQEGILSLMQMAKTVSALHRFRAVRLPYISICLHPTTGGVAASTAFLGDVNVVEPNALIGFAGPRVIEGTIRQKLPEGFQSSEFLLEHGMVDTIVPRAEMKARLDTILGHLCSGRSSDSRSSDSRSADSRSADSRGADSRGARPSAETRRGHV